MNGLCRLSGVKTDIVGVPGTTANDAIYIRAIDEVSAEFSREADRQFFAWQGARVFPGSGTGLLLLHDDLISASAVAADLDLDGTFETTLTLNTDYWLWPLNVRSNEPYRGIQLNPISSRLVHWPEYPRVLQVTGLWGYSAETEDSGLTGTVANGTATTITANADATAAIYPGDTLVIESEQLHVSAVADTAITVQRAINGTTAAAHSAKSLLVRRYPRDVEMAVAERVVGLRWDAQGGYTTADALTGQSAPNRASYARWRRAVERYSLPVVG